MTEKKNNTLKELERIRVYAEDIIDYLMLGKCQRNKALFYASKIIEEVSNLQESFNSFNDSQ